MVGEGACPHDISNFLPRTINHRTTSARPDLGQKETKDAVGLPMNRIYIAGAYVNESHVRLAWSRLRAGIMVEVAAASAMPSSKRINSVTRGAYQNSLVTVLNLKRQLFTKACEEARKGGDWRRFFLGRRSVFWPDIQERTELGLSDYTRHEIILKEPYRGRPIKVKMTIDHKSRSVREAAAVFVNGH